MTRTQIVWAALAAAGAGCAAQASAPARGVRLPEGARMLDLTHSFDERTLYWPTSPSGFALERLSFGKTPGGFFYAANKLCAPEHGGTHLDSPIHFAEGKSTAEAIPLSRLVAPAVVIDITRKAGADADALLGPEDVAAFEAAHGAIEPGTIVLVRTGWSERWPDRKRYLGDDTPGDASRLHFPGIGAAAAQKLVERRVGAVGIDTASIDHGPSKDFIAHQILLGADIPAFENLAALADVPARGALVVALPMKIAGGSGGPLRIIAVVPGR
ncbi:MAG TPA: cyclase family protein [Kofleriaceae bacterium]|nr:cyclase family protein [Kofleriaceae bacterium]